MKKHISFVLCAGLTLSMIFSGTVTNVYAKDAADTTAVAKATTDITVVAKATADTTAVDNDGAETESATQVSADTKEDETSDTTEEAATDSSSQTYDKEYIETTLNLANNEDQEWTYSSDADAWVLSITSAVAYPEIPDEQGVSVCVPGAYVKGIDTDGDGEADVTAADATAAVKGSLVIDYDATITSTNGQTYTAATAPIILNTGAAGYSSSTNTLASTTYAKEGYINVACGNRGKQDTVTDSDGNTTYTGDAPSCLVDQKNAARFVKYNILLGNLPGNVDYLVSTGGSGGGAHAVMFASTGNNSDYFDYEIEAGAVGVYKEDDGTYSTEVTIDGTSYEISDGAWGCVAYSAITSLAEGDMAMAFEYYMDTDYDFGSDFQAQMAEYLSQEYMDYINNQNLSVNESDVGFDLNGDGDQDDNIALTIEYDTEKYADTNGYGGTYLDLYLAEFTSNLQWYLDNLDYADGWTWFDEDGNALSDEDVAAMTSEEKAQAFLEGRYAKSSSGGMDGGPGNMGGGPGNMGGGPGNGGNAPSLPDGASLPDGTSLPDGATMPDGAGPDDESLPDGTSIPDGATMPDGAGPDDASLPDGAGPDDASLPDGAAPDDASLPDGAAPDDASLPDGAGPDDASLPDGAALPDGETEADGISNADVAANSTGDTMKVGTPDAGTTQSAGSQTDSNNYSSYEDMLAAYESDIASIEAGDEYGNNIVSLYNPLNYIGQEDTEDATWVRIMMGAAEGDMSMFNSLNLQIAMLNAGVDCNIEWQWDGGHVPSEIFSESFSLYVDQMYGEYVNGNTIETPAAETQTENGTADSATGTDISSWVDSSDLSNVTFTLADAVSYRTAGASKAIPGFDVIDYGQEDYVFGDSSSDARHWDTAVLKVLQEHQDTLEELFNKEKSE